MKKIFLLLICSQQIVGYAQNIGIGTNNPYRAKLEVHGVADHSSNVAIFGGESSGISLQRNWPAVGFNTYFHNDLHRLMSPGYGMMQVMDPTNGYLAFDMMPYGPAGAHTGIRRAMVITNQGRVNIGSNIPYANLNVARGNLNPHHATAAFEGSTHHSFFNYKGDENTYIRAGKDNGTLFLNDIPGSKISMGGLVGIGTDNPYYPLEIRQPGSDKGWDLVNANNNVDWEYRVTGSLGWLQTYYNGNYVARFNQWGVYENVSDGRLKSNIQALPSLLSKVMQLRPVSYEMIHNNPCHAKAIGFVAQDVKTLFPELVSVTDDTAANYKGMQGLHTLNYSSFGVLAIKAIQEQQQLIQSLQVQLTELKEAFQEREKK